MAHFIPLHHNTVAPVQQNQSAMNGMMWKPAQARGEDSSGSKVPLCLESSGLGVSFHTGNLQVDSARRHQQPSH